MTSEWSCLSHSSAMQSTSKWDGRFESSLNACSHFFKRPGEEVEKNEPESRWFQKERSKYLKAGEQWMKQYLFILSYPTIFFLYHWGGIIEVYLYKTFSKSSIFEYFNNINYNNYSKVISTTALLCFHTFFTLLVEFLPHLWMSSRDLYLVLCIWLSYCSTNTVIVQSKGAC